jgi:hypothetical protein
VRGSHLHGRCGAAGPDCGPSRPRSRRRGVAGVSDDATQPGSDLLRRLDLVRGCGPVDPALPDGRGPREAIENPGVVAQRPAEGLGWVSARIQDEGWLWEPFVAPPAAPTLGPAFSPAPGDSARNSSSQHPSRGRVHSRSGLSALPRTSECVDAREGHAAVRRVHPAAQPAKHDWMACSLRVCPVKSRLPLLFGAAAVRSAPKLVFQK